MDIQRLAVVGVSFRNAPLCVREKLAIGAGDLRPALDRLAALPGVAGVVILSTCNRVEAYIDSDADAVGLVAASVFAVADPGLVYRKRGPDAALHAFRVAAGLDAMALGDAQVLGQWKAAFRAAETAGSLSPALLTLRDRAIRAARDARTFTGIGCHALSVSHVAVELVRKVFADLGGRRVLILGSGKMCTRAARRLVEAGARATVVAGREIENARRLAEELGGSAAPPDALAAELAVSDVVVSGTACPNTLITRAMVEAAVHVRGGRPLLIVDIAVPRDVDADVRSVPGVFLYDMDDLRGIADANAGERRRESAAAERVVGSAAAALAREHHEAAPLVVRLRARAEEIRSDEVRRAMSRLGPLSAEQQAAVDAATRAIVNKILHAPTAQLRDLGERGNKADLRFAGALLGLA